MADTISSQSDWKANQKRAEKKAKTTTQPPMSEGDMVLRFRARNGGAAREAREKAKAKSSKNAAKRLETFLCQDSSQSRRSELN